ncbi:DUF7508 domain-containing protein [Haloarcula amylovorans]|uniref:DUF7508 domain-containing protein n=1 Tax=Haloarcula amylovorans TaxID=2562280 RepID=UPI001076426C|nr:GIY-YIG nuclease family protein [Halomicroarcula amylolytica]
MPIGKTWSKATESHIKNNVPTRKGVYELHSFGEVKYIGSSKNLQHRLLEHLDKRNPNKYRFKTVGFLTRPVKAERKHYDRHVDKYGSEPDWNDRQP